MPSIFHRKDKQTHPLKSFSVPSREKVNPPVVSRPNGQTSEFGGLQSTLEPFTSSNTVDPLPPLPPPILPPRYVFATTRLPTITSTNSIDSFAYSQDENTRPKYYGLIGGVGAKVTLSLEEVGRVIKVVGAELERRALTTPLLFSNQALDVSPTRVRALIQSYIDSIRSSSTPLRDAWERDLTYVREHDLGWLLRWALSRIVRIREGTQEVLHGVLEWEVYEEWRGRERASNYPHDAFPYLSALAPAKVYHIILKPLLRLLSRFAAHSHLSGLTPHALSSLFAPFVFDVPTSTPSMVSHAAYVRAAYATEHLLLSYIRASGQGEGLGVTNLPGRLREWVSGYPAMVASDADLARAAPRKGARTVRCERASRIVRAYSKDLLLSAESWAGDVQEWTAWDRVILKGKRGEPSRPKFSSAYKRRLVIKDSLPILGSATSGIGDSYDRARRPTVTSDKREKNKSEDGEELLWDSLAGKEWSMFEEGGFDAPSLTGKRDDMRSRLQFDLNESAKMSVVEKRRTMDWTDFAAPSGGFTRTDPVLDVSLSFAKPLSSSIQEWPKEREDLDKRLHKSQKDATPFSYDTTPKVGVNVPDKAVRPDHQGRVYIEESFVDWWADWAIGSGWMDRDERTFKESNWVIVEYKARPSRPEDVDDDPRVDPRSSDLYFIFEERVPLDYQLAVADPKEKKTLATLFNSRKKRINSSPAKGRVSSGWEDSDFDRMLLHRDKTTKLTLSHSEPPHSSVWQLHRGAKSPTKPIIPRSLSTNRPVLRTRTKSNDHPDPHLSEGKASFFNKSKERVVRRAKSRTEDGSTDKVKIQKPHEIDFELHSASGISSPDSSPRDGVKKDNEKWMDILIANGAKRMDRRDVPLASSRPPVVAHQPGGPPPPAQSMNPPLPNKPPSPPKRDDLPPTPRPSDRDLGPGGLYNDLEPEQFTQHSPETSGSDAEVVVTPRDKGDVQRWPSENRKPAVPVKSCGSIEGLRDESPVRDHGQNGYDHRSSGYITIRGSLKSETEVPVPYVYQRSTPREILQPSPRRDTIHNIVDTYRDSSFTTSSDLDESEVPSRHDPDAFYTSRFKEDDLVPPTLGPVFDLTPGREPSPARYKHGEPLQRVGEDEEEEY